MKMSCEQKKLHISVFEHLSKQTSTIAYEVHEHFFTAGGQGRKYMSIPLAFLDLDDCADKSLSVFLGRLYPDQGFQFKPPKPIFS